METNSHAFLDGYAFYSIKMNIKDSTTGCVGITFFEITLNEQDQVKLGNFGKNI